MSQKKRESSSRNVNKGSVLIGKSHSLEGKLGPIIANGHTSKTGWIPSHDPTADRL